MNKNNVDWNKIVPGLINKRAEFFGEYSFLKISYCIVFIDSKLPNRKYFNAYAWLPKPTKRELDNQTYGGNSRLVGIDTAHYYNWDMNEKEKLSDAKIQIQELIKDYFKIK